MKKSLGALISLLMSTSLTQAAVDAAALAQTFVDDGYSRVEVKVGPTLIKVEAIKGDTRIEVMYDADTGAVLKSETGPIESGDDLSPGVFITQDSHDSTASDEFDDDNTGTGGGGDDATSDDDDDQADDHGQDSGAGGDDSGSDNGGGGDDDSGDDHGGGDD